MTWRESIAEIWDELGKYEQAEAIRSIDQLDRSQALLLNDLHCMKHARIQANLGGKRDPKIAFGERSSDS